MIVKNFDSANEYYDLSSGAVLKTQSKPKYCGWYKVIDGILSALVVENGLLFIVWNNDKHLSNDAFIELTDVFNRRRKLSLYISEREVLHFEYPIEEDYSNIAPFEYLDKESFDWGMFIKNIINNKERSKIIVENLSE